MSDKDNFFDESFFTDDDTYNEFQSLNNFRENDYFYFVFDNDLNNNDYEANNMSTRQDDGSRNKEKEEDDDKVLEHGKQQSRFNNQKEEDDVKEIDEQQFRSTGKEKESKFLEFSEQQARFNNQEEENKTIEFNDQYSSSNNQEEEDKVIKGTAFLQDVQKQRSMADVYPLQKTGASKENANELQNGISSIFSTRKNMPKVYIRLMHNRFLTKDLDFKKMSRAEYRCNYVYYNNYAHMKYQILQCLELHKDEIFRTILNNYKFKKIIE